MLHLGVLRTVLRRDPMAEPVYGPNQGPIEVMPVVVLFQVFPARPSSIPDIRDFVRRCLAESPLTEEGNREVGETVFRALLDAAGPSGSIQVAFRIFPEHVEVDVLHSDLSAGPPASEPRPADGPATAAGATGAINGAANGLGGPALNGSGGPAQITAPGASFVHLGQDGQPANFADWMSVALRREGLTQEAAARLLGVSVKTVSRWVGGATEPRLRDLRRIQEVFGEIPLQ
jgi:DNA-binding XRE family transcriptional regulator